MGGPVEPFADPWGLSLDGGPTVELTLPLGTRAEVSVCGSA